MPRPEKNNADYFRHDNDMRNDPKLKAVRKKFREGYAVYNMLLEVLTDADHFTIEISPLQLELLAGDFDVDSNALSEIIDYCVKIELLCKEGNTVFSAGLKKRMLPLVDKRNSEKIKYQKQKDEKAGVSAAETTEVPVFHNVSASEIPHTILDKTILYKSIEIQNTGGVGAGAKPKTVKKPPAPVTDVQLPWGDDFKSIWEQWKAYKKKEHSFGYKSAQSQQAAINKLVKLADGKEDIAKAIIIQSMENGWQGFFELKNKTTKNEQPITGVNAGSEGVLWAIRCFEKGK